MKEKDLIMDKSQKDLSCRIADINSKKDAMINVLNGYCENIIENPSKECLFDILVILREMKKQSVELRKEINLLNDFNI